MNSNAVEDNTYVDQSQVEYNGPTEEVKNRWLSWSIVSGAKWIATRQYGVKQSYQGTVTDKEKAKRRAKNKVAKASRKANR